MWCPNCKIECVPETSRCPDCGAELVSHLPAEDSKATWSFSYQGNLGGNWPTCEDGSPEKAAYLVHCTSLNFEDEMLINMLDAYGIPAVRNYPENGSLGKIILGISGNGADIYVPVSMLEDAKALLEDGQND